MQLGFFFADPSSYNSARLRWCFWIIHPLLWRDWPVLKQNTRLWVKLLQTSDLRKRTRIKHRLALLLNYLAWLIYSETGISHTLKEWHSKSRDFFHQESCIQIHLYNNFMGDQNQTVFAVTRLSLLYIKMELKVSNSGVTTLKTRNRKRLVFMS